VNLDVEPIAERVAPPDVQAAVHIRVFSFPSFCVRALRGVPSMPRMLRGVPSMPLRGVPSMLRSQCKRTAPE
jgi:hypothetical protein